MDFWFVFLINMELSWVSGLKIDRRNTWCFVRRTWWRMFVRRTWWRMSNSCLKARNGYLNAPVSGRGRQTDEFQICSRVAVADCLSICHEIVEGHPKFSHLSCDDDRWPEWKVDAEKYWDELRKSGGYDVKSPYGRVDLRSHGVELLLEGEMDDTESTEIANFAITQHKKGLPLEEHHSLLRVEWVTVVRYLYYKYYFTMMVKDSSGKDHSCRAKIVICPEGCKFLIEYGLGPFAEFTTLPPEYDYECTFSSIPISNERKPEFLMMQSYTNGDVYMEEAQESSDEDMEEAQETNGRMTVYKFEHCIHLRNYPVIT